jgi:hypothetical protein
VDVRRKEDLLDYYEPAHEPLTLSATERSQIETILGVGATSAGTALLTAVTRLGTISIGDVRVEFSPGQKEELKRRAVKRGITPAEEIRRVVEYVLESFWNV